MSTLNQILLAGLLVLVIIGSGAVAIRWSSSDGASTIGANEVPSDLHCQEDEVIGFEGAVEGEAVSDKVVHTDGAPG